MRKEGRRRVTLVVGTLSKAVGVLALAVGTVALSWAGPAALLMVAMGGDPGPMADGAAYSGGVVAAGALLFVVGGWFMGHSSRPS